MVSLTSQLSALRRLAAADADRALLSRRIASGLSVADIADTTGTLTRSRAITRTTTQLTFVQTSLDTGIGAVSAASNAITAAGGTLAGMRAVLTMAKDPAADLRQLQSQFTALGNTLRAGVASAVFKGNSLLATSGSTAFDAAPTDERGQTYAIGVDLARTRLLDTMGTSGILQRSFDLSGVVLDGGAGAAASTLGLSGTATLTVGRNAVSAPGTGGLGGSATSSAGQATNAAAPAATGLSGNATAVAGTADSSPSTDGLGGTATRTNGSAEKVEAAATALIGVRNANEGSYGADDTVELKVTLNGTEKTVKVYQRAVTDKQSFQTELQRAVDAQFGQGTLIATVNTNASGGQITLKTAATGSGQNLAVTSVNVRDGNDITTTTLGLATQTSYSSTAESIAGANRIRDSLGKPTLTGIDTQDRLRIVIDGQTVNSDGNVASQGTITVNVSLASVTDARTLADAINAAIQADSQGKNFFGADLNSAGEVVVYHKASNGRIRVSDIDALNGNGSLAGNLGLATGSGTGTSAAPAVQASNTAGSAFTGSLSLANGAALKFDLQVDTGALKTVTINENTVKTALNSQTGVISNVSQFVIVAARALSDAGVTGVAVSADNGRLKFTKTGTAADGDTITMSNVQVIASAATRATLTTGTDFAGPLTIAANASLDFTLAVGAQNIAVSVTRADVKTALNVDTGTIGNAAQFADVVQAALNRANAASGVTVAADGSRLKFTKTSAGAATLGISNIAGRSTATNALATGGSDFTGPITLGDDAAITFGIQLDNGALTTLRIDKATTESVLGGRSTISTVAELASVAQRALANASVTGITVGTSGSRLTFARNTAGAGSVTLGTVTATGSAATQTSLRTGSDFSGPVTVETGASIGFDLTLDGGSAQRVTINRSTVEAALAGRNTINTTTEFAQVVSQALSEASVAGVTVNVVGNGIELRKTAAGTGSLSLGNVAAVAGSGGAGTTPGTTTLDTINLAGAGIQAMNASDRAALIESYIRNLDAISTSVAGAAGHLAMVGHQLDIQSAHTTRLQTIETGRLNSQVKTDMDRETARKAALDARIALARQSLGIISESRKNVLALLTP